MAYGFVGLSQPLTILLWISRSPMGPFLMPWGEHLRLCRCAHVARRFDHLSRPSNSAYHFRGFSL